MDRDTCQDRAEGETVTLESACEWERERSR